MHGFCEPGIWKRQSRDLSLLHDVRGLSWEGWVRFDSWELTSSQGVFTLTLVHGMGWEQRRQRAADQSAHTGPLHVTGLPPSMAATSAHTPCRAPRRSKCECSENKGEAASPVKHSIASTILCVANKVTRCPDPRRGMVCPLDGRVARWHCRMSLGWDTVCSQHWKSAIMSPRAQTRTHRIYLPYPNTNDLNILKIITTFEEKLTSCIPPFAGCFANAHKNRQSKT